MRANFYGFNDSWLVKGDCYYLRVITESLGLPPGMFREEIANGVVIALTGIRFNFKAKLHCGIKLYKYPFIHYTNNQKW